jgi:hypothetical protein
MVDEAAAEVDRTSLLVGIIDVAFDQLGGLGFAYLGQERSIVVNEALLLSK